MNTLPPIPLRFSNSADHPRISRRVLEPAVLWNRPAPAPRLDLSGSYDFSPFRYPSLIETQARVLDRFADAHLLWSDCILLDDFFHCTFFNAGHSHARSLATREPGGEEQRASGLGLIEDRLVIDRARLANPIMIEEPVLAATPNEPRHWGLFLLHSVPALAAFAREPRRYGRLFIHPGQPNVRDMLALFGISDADVISHDVSACYRLKDVRQLRHSHWFFYIHKSDRRIYRALAERVQRMISPRPRRIFVSRLSHTRAGGHRGLMNEEELINALVPLGFTVVEPELLSAAEQIATFAGAEAIIGLAGAAMFNAVFCRPGTKLLDLESSGYFVEAHANIFGSCGLDYAMLLGSIDPTDTSQYNRRWHLDIDRAMPVIRGFFAI